MEQLNEREAFADPTNHLLRSIGKGNSQGTFGFGGLEASYEFSAKDLLTASADMFLGKRTTKGNSTTNMFDENGGDVYSYLGYTRSKDNFNGINASVDFQHQFAHEDQNLTLSYRFSSNKHEEESTNYYSDLYRLPYTLTDLQVDPDGKTQEHTAQVDFTTPLAKIHTLSVGTKYIYRINRSDN